MSIISTSNQYSLQSHNYTQLNKKITTLTDNVTSVSIHNKVLNQLSIYGLLLKVKYIKAKSDSINSYPIIVQDLKFIVTLQSDDNQNCYTWKMYPIHQQ